MELELAGHLGVDFSISTLRVKSRDRLLKVEVTGQYESKTGPFLTMIVAAALANPFGSGIGLIFDASGLQYTGGDELLDWVYLVRKELTEQYLVSIVTSAQNHQSVLSLIADLELDILDGFVHQSVSAARAAIENHHLET